MKLLLIHFNLKDGNMAYYMSHIPIGASLVAQLVKNLPAMQKTPGLGRSPGGGHGNPLQYSCLENPMDRGAWQTTVHGVKRVGHDLATKPPPYSHYIWVVKAKKWDLSLKMRKSMKRAPGNDIYWVPTTCQTSEESHAHTWCLLTSQRHCSWVLPYFIN